MPIFWLAIGGSFFADFDVGHPTQELLDAHAHNFVNTEVEAIRKRVDREQLGIAL
jgi:hypothetical protein